MGNSGVTPQRDNTRPAAAIRIFQAPSSPHRWRTTHRNAGAFRYASCVAAQVAEIARFPTGRAEDDGTPHIGTLVRPATPRAPPFRRCAAHRGGASFVTTWLMYGKSCFFRLTIPGKSKTVGLTAAWSA